MKQRSIGTVLSAIAISNNGFLSAAIIANTSAMMMSGPEPSLRSAGRVCGYPLGRAGVNAGLVVYIRSGSGISGLNIARLHN
jgi:hypothetical protein